MESPPAEVWSRITDELSLDPDRAEPTVIPLPDARRTPNASVRRFRGRALVAAAAVAAVLGAGVGVGATLIVQDDEKPTVQAVVPLSALEGRSGTGTADLLKAASGEQLKVTASGLAAAAGYYEVWMINTDGKRMVSLGVLDPSSAGTFQLPAQLIAQGYRIVDISLEPDDGNPEHSRNSIIRGTLPA
nr:anti-sigma factor [Kribbella sandramycini]